MRKNGQNVMIASGVAIMLVALVLLSDGVLASLRVSASDGSDIKELKLNQAYVDTYTFEPSNEDDESVYPHDKVERQYFFKTSPRESDYRIEGRILGKQRYKYTFEDGNEPEYPEWPYAEISIFDKNKRIQRFSVSDAFRAEKRESTLKRNKKYYIKVDFESDIEKEKLKLCVKEIIHKPGKTKITSLKAGKRKLTVKYSKSKYARKYQVSIKKKGSKKWSKPYTTTKRFLTIKKLKCKRKYYVRVRGYLNNAGTVYKSKWSRAKIIKTR